MVSPLTYFTLKSQPGSLKTQVVEGLVFVVVVGDDQLYVSVNKADIIMASLQQTRRKYTTVSDLRRVLQQKTECQQHAPPHVMLSTLQDAESLFGVELKEKVVLRIPGKCAGSCAEGEILCRHPECCKRNLQAQGSGNRRELYLCPTHVDRLNTVFSQVIKGGPVADENFSLSMEDHDQKDLIESVTDRTSGGSLSRY